MIEPQVAVKTVWVGIPIMGTELRQPKQPLEKTLEQKQSEIIQKRLAEAPKSYEDLFKKWDNKIRSTARNKKGISYDEIEDVVQEIYAKAIEKKWLRAYTGETEFSTFIYTYILREIQNYINIRDCHNYMNRKERNENNEEITIKIPRYAELSQMACDDEHITNLIDKLSYNMHLSNDYEEQTSNTIFIEELQKYGVRNLLTTIDLLTIIKNTLKTYEVHKVNKRTKKITISRKEYDYEDTANSLGIEVRDIKAIIKGIEIYQKEGTNTALRYIEKRFERI